MGLAADPVSHWLRQPPSVVVFVPSPSIPGCLSNTRDQLRGVHDLALVHDDRADRAASTRLQPPLVSCIALFCGGAIYRGIVLPTMPSFHLRRLAIRSASGLNPISDPTT
jgi:hypothetical protein